MESQKFQARYKDKQIKFLESKVNSLSGLNQNQYKNFNHNSLSNDNNKNINLKDNIQSKGTNDFSCENKFINNANPMLNRTPVTVENLANPRKISPKMLVKDITNTNNSLKSTNTKIENLNSRTSKMLSGSTLNNYTSTSKRNAEILNTDKSIGQNENNFETNNSTNKNNSINNNSNNNVNTSINNNISNYRGNVSKNTKTIQENLDSKSIKFNKVEVNKQQTNSYFTTPIGNYNRDFAEYYYK